MKRINTWLVLAVIVPLVVLFWPMPYKPWNDTVDWVLYTVPTLAAQVLFCRVGKWNIIKIIPAVFMGAWVAWGIYINCVVSAWNSARLCSFLRLFVSPFLCCVLVLVAFLLLKKKR